MLGRNASSGRSLLDFGVKADGKYCAIEWVSPVGGVGRKLLHPLA